MKITLLRVTLISALLVSASELSSQVTIGATVAPEKGAILQLKDSTTNDNNSVVNASKGLALPRVKLTDINKLKPMYSYADQANTPSADDEKKHTGLLVYNIEKCISSGKGLYVWTGTEWLAQCDVFVPTLSQTYFDLLSGVDARGPITAQDLQVTWGGASTGATWDVIPEIGGGVPLTSPAANGNLDSYPYTMSILPTTMTITPTTPWQSLQSKIVFKNLASDCGVEDIVTINQTNYALKANNTLGSSAFVYSTATSTSFAVQSNAMWKISKIVDPNNILASTTLSVGSQYGQELKDGSTPPAQAFGLTTNLSPKKYDNSVITLQDVAEAKRFHDVEITVLSCQGLTDPTLEEWAERLGFSTLEISNVSDAQSGSSVVKNGYQLHRDQDGNLFISSEFGLDANSADGRNRWMAVNLIAQTFSATGRTGDDAQVNAGYLEFTGGNTSAWAAWCYTGGGHPLYSLLYDANKRMGKQYNWAAATNNRGQYALDGTQLDATGMREINDGENSSSPQARIQGICPNGWHLPSDAEWTQLEQEINTNTNKYAYISDVNATITIGEVGWRGSTHGQAMKDVCPIPNKTSATNGASRSIGSHGFGIMLVGYSYSTWSADSASRNMFWTSSGNDTNYAWLREFNASSSSVLRHVNSRGMMYSIRCKKD